MFALFCAAVCTLPASTVTLTIAPAEQTVLHLLPACVTAELRNEGDTTTTLGGFGLGGLTLDATRWRLCGFRVRTPDSSDVLVGMTDWIYTDIDIPHRLPVLPGPGTRQSLDYSVSCGVLDQDRKQYKSNSRTVLVAPGTYSVQMLMDQPLSRVESNVARIVVQMPSQPEDIAVYGLLMKLPQPYLLMAQVAGISGCVGRGPEPKYSLGCAEEIKVCTEIVTRYPTSAYAPYARVFLGGLIIVGGTDRPGEVPDREKRLEGMRLLREAVADPRLIRRWRDAALVTIVDSVRSLSDDNRRQGTVSVKPLDEVLGEKVNVPLSSVGLYKAAYLAAKGTGSKDDLQFAQDTLRRYLTSAQIETVKKYALSDPAVEEAINLSPFDLEIETHADWARAELRKIPWRDANTGELTFAAIPKGSR
jgi:hypothetical protein